MRYSIYQPSSSFLPPWPTADKYTKSTACPYTARGSVLRIRIHIRVKSWIRVRIKIKSKNRDSDPHRSPNSRTVWRFTTEAYICSKWSCEGSVDELSQICITLIRIRINVKSLSGSASKWKEGSGSESKKWMKGTDPQHSYRWYRWQTCHRYQHH